MRDVLRFLWIAFIDHWATWVTGTGVVGLLLWALNYYERVRGTPMKLRTNILILFCTFWFFATFAAWHDADKNLDQARKKDGADAKELISCQGDLKAEIARSQLFDGQLHSSQNNFETLSRNLSQQQQTMNSQQVAMNSCVVALGKANTPEPQTTTIQFLGASISDEKANHHTYMLAFTNKVVAAPIRGAVGCEHPVKKMTMWVLGSGTMSGGLHQINETTGQWEINHPSWTPTSPLVFVFHYDGDDLGRCGMRLL